MGWLIGCCYKKFLYLSVLFILGETASKEYKWLDVFGGQVHGLFLDVSNSQLVTQVVLGVFENIKGSVILSKEQHVSIFSILLY